MNTADGSKVARHPYPGWPSKLTRQGRANLLAAVERILERGAADEIEKLYYCVTRIEGTGQAQPRPVHLGRRHRTPSQS